MPASGPVAKETELQLISQVFLSEFQTELMHLQVLIVFGTIPAELGVKEHKLMHWLLSKVVT